MSKRQQALTTITAIVAQEGRVTQAALREYVEHRISRESFDRAVALGLRCYHAQEREGA